MRSIASVYPFEIEIKIVATGRIGVWANEIASKGASPVRTAGQLPAGDANPHTQQAVALLSPLSRFTHKQRQRLAEFNGVPKPRVKITALDAHFAQAVQDRLVNSPDAPKRLKAASAIASELIDRLRMFALTWEVPPDSAALLSLRSWSKQQVNDPRELKKVPTVFLPAVVST